MAAEVRVEERHEKKEKSGTETPLTIEDFTTEESIETVKVTVLYYIAINTKCWPHTIIKASVQYMDFDLLNFFSRPLQDPASTCVTLQIPMETGDVPKQTRKVCCLPQSGTLHQKKFYRLHLIFWLVTGCGTGRFGRRGLKTTWTCKPASQNFCPQGAQKLKKTINNK